MNHCSKVYHYLIAHTFLLNLIKILQIHQKWYRAQGSPFFSNLQWYKLTAQYSTLHHIDSVDHGHGLALIVVGLYL